jgi:hypothetical protein
MKIPSYKYLFKQMFKKIGQVKLKVKTKHISVGLSTLRTIGLKDQWAVGISDRQTNGLSDHSYAPVLDQCLI